MIGGAFRAVDPNLGPPDVLGLQLPEILAIRGSGEGFWELQSKNIWRPKVGDHCFKWKVQTCVFQGFEFQLFVFYNIKKDLMQRLGCAAWPQRFSSALSRQDH